MELHGPISITHSLCPIILGFKSLLSWLILFEVFLILIKCKCAQPTSNWDTASPSALFPIHWSFSLSIAVILSCWVDICKLIHYPPAVRHKNAAIPLREKMDNVKYILLNYKNSFWNWNKRNCLEIVRIFFVVSRKDVSYVSILRYVKSVSFPKRNAVESYTKVTDIHTKSLF
jgi:hypothetical protein